MSIVDIPEPDRVEGAPHPRHTVQLFGQDRAERGFLDAYGTGRLHHGWLITGPRGVGKATLAWRIARFLLSREEGGGLLGDTPPLPDRLDLAADHPVSRRVAALTEPGLLLCRRPWDDKRERLKQAITVDEVRRVKSFFNLSATEGGRRVVIVDAADEMNVAAANALLKILEEPPARSTLLLVAHRPMALLPTIRSRCRVLACAPLGPGDMASALAGAGFDAGDDTARLAQLALGSVGEAIRLLSQDGLEMYGELVRLFAHDTGLDRQAAIRLAESCSGTANAARYDLVLRLLAVLLHRLARAGVVATGKSPEAAPGEAAFLHRFAQSAPAARRWADLAEALASRGAHGRAVNLDPAALILDMLLKIDQVASSLKAA